MAALWQGASALAASPEAQWVWQQGPVRLGYIDYLNCLPVYYGIENGIIDLPVAVKRGPPAAVNAMLLAGDLDIAPISSIELARHHRQCLALPDLSISADGRVESILLFRRVPWPEVRRVALTSASATSAVLTKIILQRRYGLAPAYVTMAPDLGSMLSACEAALVIGDDALLGRQAVRTGCFGPVEVLDLGEAWQALTGEMMVYALWVVRRQFADRSPAGVRLVARLLRESQAYGWAHRSELLAAAQRRRRLPRALIAEYFRTIRHDLGPASRRALATFWRLAHEVGELPAVPRLCLWGEEGRA